MPVFRTFFVVAVMFSGILVGTFALAATVEYELTIAQEEVNFTGKPTQAMTINGGIPGPALRFTEGDLARVTVHNRMDVESSIHWHGILVPPDMDGVPLLNFPPIAPDASFTYEFPIRQSGTYWYHSHTGMQEQQGVYGSIVIQPRHPESPADRDYVVLLSDWTDEDPHQAMRTLKRGSDWYPLEKGNAQSLFGAARIGMLGDYLLGELQRMPAMDIADVAYDRFLANGTPELTLAAEPGELVRVRIIDGSSTSFFYLEFAGGPLRIVSADGQNVEPIMEQRLLIGVAETYDVIVPVLAAGAWELRATAHDGSGHASVWIGHGKRHPAPAVPMPNLYAAMGGLDLQRTFALTPAGAMGMSDADVDTGRFDQPGMMMMDHGGHGKRDITKQPEAGMAHGGHDMHDMAMEDDSAATHKHSASKVAPETPDGAMDHGGHDMNHMAEEPAPEMDRHGHAMHETGEVSPVIQTPDRGGKRYGGSFRPLAADISSADNLAVDGMDPARPWPPYEKLRATHVTALPSEAPVREIRLTLDGDMERYVWSLNNRGLTESDDIPIREGEVVRFIMINRTMMHHPMHLHGHFFRVVNGQGDYSPLKHTVDVAPMSTTVIEFMANEVGDWFFHCHLLYHMESGMARVVHYENFNLTPQLARLRPQLYKDFWYAWGQVDALSNMAEGTLTLSNTRNILSAEVEGGWQEVGDADWEALLLWSRYLNRFAGVLVGANLGDAMEDNRGVLGVHYLLPFLLETRGFVGTDGEARVEIEREFQLLPRLAVDGRVQYETDGSWETLAGLSCTLNKEVSLRVQWHTDYRWGVGLQFRF